MCSLNSSYFNRILSLCVIYLLWVSDTMILSLCVISLLWVSDTMILSLCVIYLLWVSDTTNMIHYSDTTVMHWYLDCYIFYHGIMTTSTKLKENGGGVTRKKVCCVFLLQKKSNLRSPLVPTPVNHQYKMVVLSVVHW